MMFYPCCRFRTRPENIKNRKSLAALLYSFGQLLHLFPFLYFLQHFFFFLASTMGKGKGRRIAAGLVSILFFLACIVLASLSAG